MHVIRAVLQVSGPDSKIKKLNQLMQCEYYDQPSRHNVEGKEIVHASILIQSDPLTSKQSMKRTLSWLKKNHAVLLTLNANITFECQTSLTASQCSEALLLPAELVLKLAELRSAIVHQYCREA